MFEERCFGVDESGYRSLYSRKNRERKTGEEMDRQRIEDDVRIAVVSKVWCGGQSAVEV